MNRIEVSSSDTGPSNYTFAVNPSAIDGFDEAFVSKNDVLHGASIYQKQSFDSRPRVLKWSGFPYTNNDIDSIITYFRSIEGEIRYYNFRDIETFAGRWDTAGATDDDWKKARAVNLKITHRKGGALIYDTIELTLQPERP